MSKQETPLQSNDITFGRYLRAARTRQNIHLDTISQQTRIGMDLLLLIEDENHARLPAEVYVKGFLKAYAETVGVDAITVIQKYKQSVATYRQTASAQRGALQSGSRFWPQLLLVIFVLSVIIGLTVYTMSHFSEPSGKEAVGQEIPSGFHEDPAADNTEKVPVPEHYHDSGEVPQTDQDPPKNDVAQNETGIYYLHVLSLEDTWLKVIVDENTPLEYKMKKGEQLTLKAVSGYNILLGDPESAALSLNGKPVFVQGKRGQMVNIQLPGRNE